MQHITYCGDAHFQNGIAKRVIKDIQEQAQKQLLLARARSPEAMHLTLWTFAVRYTIYIHNTVPSQDDGCSRLKLFTGIRYGTRMKNNTFLAVPFLPSKMISREVTQFQNGFLVLDKASALVLPHWMLSMSTLCSTYPQAQCLHSTMSEMMNSLKPPITQRGTSWYPQHGNNLLDWSDPVETTHWRCMMWSTKVMRAMHLKQQSIWYVTSKINLRSQALKLMRHQM